MFEDLERRAIARSGEVEGEAYLAEKLDEQLEKFKHVVQNENEQALSELKDEIKLLAVPEIVSEAAQLVKLHPQLNKKISLSTVQIDWMANADYLECATSAPDVQSTPMELRALSGYAIFIKPKTLKARRLIPNNSGPNAWREPSGLTNDFNYFQGQILYALSFVYGNRDTLLPAKWVAEPELFIGGKKRKSSDRTLWNILSDERSFYVSALERRSHGGHPRTVKENEERIERLKNSAIIANENDWRAVNELLMPSVSVGRIFRREVGGGSYGKNSQAFLPSVEGVEPCRAEIAGKLEQLILSSPFSLSK